MTNNTTLAEFNGISLDIINQDGDFYLTGIQIGKALGYENPSKAISTLYERNKELLEYYTCTLNLRVQGQHRKTRVFNEEGIILLAMKSNQPVAIEMQKWIARLIKDYRHGQLSAQNNSLIVAQRALIETQRQAIEALGLLEYFRTRSNNKISAAEAEKMQQLKQSGMTNKAVAKHLGRSVDSVRK